MICGECLARGRAAKNFSLCMHSHRALRGSKSSGAFSGDGRIRGMDLNPYSSPQVDPARPTHVWKPNYRSAAFGSAALGIVGSALVYHAGRLILDYVKGAPLEIKNVVVLAVLALMVASFARLVWRALKYGERA